VKPRRIIFLRLLGFRWIKRSDHLAIMRTPMWLPGSVVDQAIVNIIADAEVKGVHVTARRGHRYVRFEWSDADA
jgi:hypothetical protein